MAGMWFAFSLIAFAVGWPDVAKSIKFLGTGIDLRDINSSLKDMRKVIEADTRAILELVQTQMRIGGVPDDQKEIIYENLTSVLNDSGFSPEEIKNIQERWHFWIAGDYVRHIIFNNAIVHPVIPSEKKEEWRIKRGDLQKRINNITPQELIDVFTEFDGYNNEVKELIKDFEFYQENKAHRRKDIWKKRAHWFSSRIYK